MNLKDSLENYLESVVKCYSKNVLEAHSVSDVILIVVWGCWDMTW